MAQATTQPFSKFLILLGDGATPTEAFTDPCGLTTKGFARTANMNDTNIPDCANPDLPSWLGRDVISYQGSLTGAGVVASESFGTWEKWWKDGTQKNVKITLGPSGASQFVWQGPCRLQEFTVTAERGQRVQMNITIVTDGAMVLTSPVTLPLEADVAEAA